MAFRGRASTLSSCTWKLFSNREDALQSLPSSAREVSNLSDCQPHPAWRAGRGVVHPSTRGIHIHPCGHVLARPRPRIGWWDRRNAPTSDGVLVSWWIHGLPQSEAANILSVDGVCGLIGRSGATTGT